MKLKKKILLIFTIMTIIPLTCLTIFSYRQYIHLINNHITSIADNQFENLSAEVRDSYNSIRRTLSFLTFYSEDDNSILSTLRQMKQTDQSFSDYDLYLASQNIKTTCQTIMYGQSNLKGIYIFSSNCSVIGHSRNSSTGIPSTYNPINDDWYQETLALNGSIYISPVDVYPMFGTDSECFFASHLIRDVDRNFQPLGVIVLEYSPKLFDLGRENAMADITQITLTNTSNQSVIYTNVKENSFNITPTEQNSTIKTVFSTPFELSMTVDFASLSSEYSKSLIPLIILFILCFLCTLLLLLQLTRNFVSPIQELSNQMVQKQIGHTKSCLKYENRKDEIGILYRQYNNMMKELDEFIKTEYQNKLIILDTQMKALEARINSHFLFNTLESINSMAELADQEEISTMTLALGHMFRYAIKTDSELVTIQDELNHVHDYIVIQRIRCDDQFRFIQNVPKNLYNQKVLKLIFQPIVENSLSHGLEYGNSGDTIALNAEMRQDLLFITISDNGRGIPEDELAMLKQSLQEEATFTELGHRKKESIGLKNIQSRIELYYGKGYGLTVRSVEGTGTQIEICIPVFPGGREV